VEKCQLRVGEVVVVSDFQLRMGEMVRVWFYMSSNCGINEVNS
jgi:hypothetical protein